MYRFHTTVLILGIVISTCFADEDEKKLSMEDVKDKFEDAIGDPMKKMGDWFKNSAEEAKAKAKDGIDTMKEFGEQAQEKSKEKIEAAKGIATGIGEHFNKMKDSLEESGEKMKEALTTAAAKAKDDFDTAASKISKHAKEASDTMFSLFQFK